MMFLTPQLASEAIQQLDLESILLRAMQFVLACGQHVVHTLHIFETFSRFTLGCDDTVQQW